MFLTRCIITSSHNLEYIPEFGCYKLILIRNIDFYTEILNDLIRNKNVF